MGFLRTPVSCEQLYQKQQELWGANGILDSLVPSLQASKQDGREEVQKVASQALEDLSWMKEALNAPSPHAFTNQFSKSRRVDLVTRMRSIEANLKYLKKDCERNYADTSLYKKPRKKLKQIRLLTLQCQPTPHSPPKSPPPLSTEQKREMDAQLDFAHYLANKLKDTPLEAEILPQEQGLLAYLGEVPPPQNSAFPPSFSIQTPSLTKVLEGLVASYQEERYGQSTTPRFSPIDLDTDGEASSSIFEQHYNKDLQAENPIVSQKDLEEELRHAKFVANLPLDRNELYQLNYYNKIRSTRKARQRLLITVGVTAAVGGVTIALVGSVAASSSFGAGTGLIPLGVIIVLASAGELALVVGPSIAIGGMGIAAFKKWQLEPSMKKFTRKEQSAQQVAAVYQVSGRARTLSFRDRVEMIDAWAKDFHIRISQEEELFYAWHDNFPRWEELRHEISTHKERELLAKLMRFERKHLITGAKYTRLLKLNQEFPNLKDAFDANKQLFSDLQQQPPEAVL